MVLSGWFSGFEAEAIPDTIVTIQRQKHIKGLNMTESERDQIMRDNLEKKPLYFSMSDLLDRKSVV